MWTRALIAAGFLALLASCGGNAGDGPAASGDVSLTLDIPDGALPQGIARGDLTVEAREAEALGDWVPLATFDLGPDGTDFNDPLIATVTAPFESGGFIAAFLVSDGREPERLEILSHDVDEEAATIVATFEVPHFSRLVLGIDHASLEVVEPADAEVEVGSSGGPGTGWQRLLFLRVDVGSHRLGDQIPIRFRVTEPALGEDRLASYMFYSHWSGASATTEPTDPHDFLDAIFRGLGALDEAAANADAGVPNQRRVPLSPVRVVADAGSTERVLMDGSEEAALQVNLAFYTKVEPIPPSQDPFAPGSGEILSVLECTRVGRFDIAVRVSVWSKQQRSELIAFISGVCTAANGTDEDPTSATALPRPAGAIGDASLSTSGVDSCGNLEALAEGFFVNAGPGVTGGRLVFGGRPHGALQLTGTLRPDGTGGAVWEDARFLDGGPDSQQLTDIRIEPGLISAVLVWTNHEGCEVETPIVVDVDEAVTDWFQMLPAAGESDCTLAEGAVLETAPDTMTLRALLLDRETGAPATGQRLVIEVLSDDGRVAYDAISGPDGSVEVEMSRPEADGSSTVVTIIKGAHVLGTLSP